MNSKLTLTIKETIDECMKLLPLGMPLYLESAPGLGKTAVMRHCSKLLTLPYVENRPAEFETVEFRGGMFLNEASRQAEWFRAAFWPDYACLLGFDEMTQAHPDITSPLLKLIREKQIGDFKLHPDTVIMATGNRVSDRAGCKRMTSALRESFIVIEVRADAKEWLEWYQADPHFNPVVADFIRRNPELIHQFDGKLDENQPAPRNWWKMGQIFSATKNPAILQGIVGREVAEDFLAFAATHNETLPTIKEILDGSKPAPTLLSDMPAYCELIVDALADGDVPSKDLANLVLDMDEQWAVVTVHSLKQHPGIEGDKMLRTDGWFDVMVKHGKAITTAMGV